MVHFLVLAPLDPLAVLVLSHLYRVWGVVCARIPRRHKNRAVHTSHSNSVLSKGGYTSPDTGVRDSIRQGGPKRTSADASVPRLAGFSLIT